MEVRPGVTGWAQVNGRNTLTWEEKFALDVWYVDNRSFWLDMKIVGLTFFRVLARSGAERPASAPPLEEFKGKGKIS
jgi:sugar transferase EpsL